jgi:hypothetical protein
MHRDRVEAMLATASANHAALLPQLPLHIRLSLPVDAQGITEAIDYVAEAAGLSSAERRTLIRPQATVMGSFVEGARVRADTLATLADLIGGAALSTEVRALLIEHPLPLADDGLAGVPALRAAYEAQERAVVVIATRLDD